MLPPAQLLRELAFDLSEFEEYSTRRPLACWRGWGSAELDGVDLPHGSRASQRRILQELQWVRTLVELGGNRSGKTEVLRAFIVALALGSDHPDAIVFWRAHGCDPDRFPRGPGRVWSVARTSSDSIRYNRPQILALVPKWGPPHPDGHGKSWATWNLKGRGESHIEVMCPGYDEPAEIWFKAEQQDGGGSGDAFDGDDVRGVHHDEEGKTAKVWVQCHFRTTDQDGWQVMSNAPIKGRTWIYERFERRGQPDARVLRLWSRDNPYLPANRARELDRDPVRGRGEFAVSSGRIWPQFNRESNILPRWTPPPDWPRFRVIDFGTRHPHACLWAVLTKSRLELGGRVVPDRSLVVYREHYQAGWTLAQHVDRYRELEGWELGPDGRWKRTPTSERIEMTWADPEDPQQILSLGNDHGIETMKGNKHREAGFNAVAEWFAPDRITGHPRLYVTENCHETIREVEDYLEIEDTDGEGTPTRKPSQRSDHTCDDLRYLVLGVRAYL